MLKTISRLARSASCNAPKDKALDAGSSKQRSGEMDDTIELCTPKAAVQRLVREVVNADSFIAYTPISRDALAALQAAVEDYRTKLSRDAARVAKHAER